MKVKKLTALCCVVLCLYTGCESKNELTSTEVANAYCNLIIYNDNTRISELGMPEHVSSSFLESLNTQLETELYSKLKLNDKVKIEESKVAELKDIYLNALSQVSFKIHEVDSDKKHLVRITTNYIDTAAIDAVATQESLAEVTLEDFPNAQDYLQELTNVYVDNLIKEYRNAKPSAGTHELYFEFHKKSNIWLPKNTDDFFAQIYQSITTQ